MKRQERIDELVNSMKSFAKDRYQKEEVLPEMLELQKELPPRCETCVQPFL